MLDFTTWLKFTTCLPKMHEATNTFNFCRNGDKNLLLATRDDNDVIVSCPKRPPYLISLFGNIHFNQVF